MRASPKWVYDRTGTLVEVPANTLGVTYDPSDLSKAPYALIEPEARNCIRNNTMMGAVVGTTATPSNWGPATNIPNIQRQVVGLGKEDGIDYVDIRIYGTVPALALPEYTIAFDSPGAISASANENWVSSVYARIISGETFVQEFEQYFLVYNSALAMVEAPARRSPYWTGSLRDSRLTQTIQISHPDAASIIPRLDVNFRNGGGYEADVVIRIGLPQMERDRLTSPIKTSGTSVTRAADVIGAGAGLVYSNAPIVEPAYDAKATYAKDAQVHDPASYEVFQSLIAGNVGKALSDTAAWSPRGIVNRRAMFDDYNNTQTVMLDEILVVLTPEMVAQGLYLGNLDVHELTLSMVDALDGVVYSEVVSLIESNSQSSYFNWMFKRIKRKTYFFVLDMPVYANALVTICLRKIGAEAKAGMCAIGPVEEFGPSLLGLSTEGKDFSSTTFNFDGTSKTTLRPYAKRMSCDVVVPNDEITYVQDRLFELRQRPLVWVGGPYGATAVFGRYGSFKNVIEYQMQSKMNLMIEGAV